MIRISPSYVTGLEKYIDELLNQVSSLKAELREICAAIDDPACDLTLTTVECIKKLKAENEALRKDAERLNFIQSNCRCDPTMDGQHKWWPTNFNKCLTGPSIRAAIDAMAQGEKK